MKLRDYIRNEVVVLEPIGKIIAGKSIVMLDEKLYSLLGRGQKKVVINLGKTSWVSSSAISILLNHNARFRKIGGCLKLANLTNKIEEIIAITKLASFFEVYDTLEQALKSFVQEENTQKIVNAVLE